MRRLQVLLLTMSLALGAASYTSVAHADVAAISLGTCTSAGSTCVTGSGTATAGATLIFCFAYDPSTTISSVTLSNAEVLTSIANLTGGNGRLACYRKENTAGGSVSATATLSGSSFPTGTLFQVTDVTTAPYDSGSLASNATDTTTPWTISCNTYAASTGMAVAAIAQNTGPSGAYASSNFTIVGSSSDVDNRWTHAVGVLRYTSTTGLTPSWTRTNSTNSAANQICFGLTEDTGGGGGGNVVNPVTGKGGAAAQPIGTLHRRAVNDDEYLLRANR